MRRQQVRLFRWLTLDRLLTAIVFIAIFTMAVRAPADSDTWWHLQSGRWIVQQRAIPQADPFSHTRLGQPWIDHGWLAQIALYLLFDAWGYAGLALLIATLVTVAMGFVWLRCRESDPPPDRWLRAFGMILTAAVTGVIWAARPQMFSFCLTAIMAFLLFRFRQGDQKALWWLPPLMVLWVNLHGGFAVGLILLVATIFGETGNWLLKNGGVGPRGIGKLALALLVCLAVVPLNPNGAQMLGYPFRTVGIGVLQDFIAEWRSPDFHQWHLHPFIWLLLAALAALGLSGRRADFTDLTLTALFAYLSLLAGRNIALFALVAAPLVLRHASIALRGWNERLERPPRVVSRAPAGGGLLALNWLLLLLVLAAAAVKIVTPVSAALNAQVEVDTLPKAAVDFIEREQPAGPIFNSYNWGGYLIWRLPDYPVFVDGRTDLYDDAFLREYLEVVLGAEGWQARLDQHNVKLVLIESQSTLARLLDNDPKWARIYSDEMASVYARE